MKSFAVAVVAAGLLSGAAFAQSHDSSMTGSTPMKPGSMGASTMPGDAMAKNGHAMDGMTMKNNRWMMGERRATKAEIAAHKRMMKAHKSMPM